MVPVTLNKSSMQSKISQILANVHELEISAIPVSLWWSLHKIMMPPLTSLDIYVGNFCGGTSLKAMFLKWIICYFIVTVCGIRDISNSMHSDHDIFNSIRDLRIVGGYQQ